VDRKKNHRRLGYKYNLCIHTVVLFFGASAYAQQAPSNTNIAGPSASATGNVTNQAVQVLQGPFAVNTYGNGTSCQGPSLNLSTFGYNSLSNSTDPTSYQQNSINAGLSAGFSIPLDGSLQELCKERVRVEIERQKAEADKAKLDFELVRSLKCLDVIKAGGFFHPDSPYGKICADIVGPSPNGYLMTGNGKIVSKINNTIPSESSNGQTKEQKR
jgi:hypothetical protein